MPPALADVLGDLRAVQVPLLAVLLLGGCAAKLVRVIRAGSVSAGLGPTDLFPRRLRRPAALSLCVMELALGTALAVTIRMAVAGDDARVAACLFFLIAACALAEVRERRPDVGCGCFGDLSARPVSRRSIIRAVLLAAAALASAGAPPLHLPVPGRDSAADLALMLAECLLLAVLSPETSEVLVRLGYSEPCETLVVPPQRMLGSLHRSAAWRRHSGAITGTGPVDMWRELCWSYVVYPAAGPGEPREIVFAVQITQRRPVVHAAVVTAPPPPPTTAGTSRPSPVDAPPPLAAPPAGEAPATLRSGTF